MKIEDGDFVCSTEFPAKLQGTVLGSVLTLAGHRLYVVEMTNREIFIGTRGSLSVLKRAYSGEDKTIVTTRQGGAKEITIRTHFNVQRKTKPT
jgi:hypothetical protein